MREGNLARAKKTYYFEVDFNFGDFEVSRVRMNPDGTRKDGQPSKLSRGGMAAGWWPGDEKYVPPIERCRCGKLIDHAAERKKMLEEEAKRRKEAAAAKQKGADPGVKKEAKPVG